MKRRWDGSVQSTNTPIYSNTGISREDFNQYRCLISKIYYVDDGNNVTKNSPNPEVTYDVVILGGPEAGQTLSNVRLSSVLGGNGNYWERTLRATSKDIRKTRLAEQDGDIVLVQFVQGHDGYPVILGVLTGTKSQYGTSSSNGPRSIQEYNGLVQEINNKGEYIIRRKGGSVVNGQFQSNSAEDVTVSITQDSIVMSTKSGASTTISGKSNNISIKAGSTEILIDGASGKVSIKAENIDLGKSVDDLVTRFSELASEFNNHIHMVPQAISGTLPSQPPNAPLVTSVGSQTVKVQA